MRSKIRLRRSVSIVTVIPTLEYGNPGATACGVICVMSVMRVSTGKGISRERNEGMVRRRRVDRQTPAPSGAISAPLPRFLSKATRHRYVRAPAATVIGFSPGQQAGPRFEWIANRPVPLPMLAEKFTA